MTRIVLTLCLLAFLIGATSAQQVPGWATDANRKWKSDPALAKICRELDSIRSHYPWNVSRVKELYVKHVVPHRAELREAKIFGKKVVNLTYFWCVALDAYFGELDIGRELGYPADPKALLERVPFDPSAEFMKVAYCLYFRYGQGRYRDTALGRRLLREWPDDPLVVESVCAQFQLIGNKEESLLALKLMKGLLTRYPDQENRYLPKMPHACLAVRNTTKDVRYHRMALAYYDQLIGSKNPYFAPFKQRYKILRDDCVKQGRKFGYGEK